MNNEQWKQARLQELDGALIPARVYNLTIGLVVLWGLAVNWLMYEFLLEPIWYMMSASPIIVLILYFGGSFGGLSIVYRSPNPVVSFLGFTLLAAAMGLILTGFLALYSEDSILLAVRITAVTTALMIILATLRPEFFLGLGRTLLVSLGICLVVETIFRLLFRFEMGWLDWLVSLVFCGYIGFDWSRAQIYPYTFDNAVDSAADIYVDIVNLFIRILRIVGRSKSGGRK